MEDSEAGRALFSLFGILVLGLVVLAIRSTPALNWIAFALGGPAAVLLLIEAATGEETLLGYSSALSAIVYAYAAYALVRYMLADHEVTRDELWAAGATFTLLAWAFAYAYVTCQEIQPGSFTGAVDPERQRTWTELLFTSFTNLSATGLGDVIPIKPFARSLAGLEQIVGVGYVVMVVSRLVGLATARR